jgi:hypothetical protein
VVPLRGALPVRGARIASRETHLRRQGLALADECRRLLIHTVSTVVSLLAVMNAWYRFNFLPSLADLEIFGDAQK